MRRVVQHRVVVTSLLALALVALFGSPASAQEPGTYANWVVSGGNGAWTGAGTPAAGFPMANMTSNATSVTAPSGASAFMGPGTPIGAAYGNSQRQNYLNISAAAGNADSTTTLTFDNPTPAGKWAFALGDVDADEVTVTATDADGNPVPVAALGFQSVFNYCDVSPKPSSCAGSSPPYDVPIWNEGTATLTGNINDTVGAAGWFEPTAAIKTLTFTFHRLAGIPIFQLWLATKSVPVTTEVSGTTSECPATLELDDATGEPILDASGNPVTAQTSGSGEATFPAVADGSYIVHMTDSTCGTNTGAVDYPIVVDTDNGPVVIPSGTFSIFVPTLPATGQAIAQHALAAIALLGGGLFALRLARRRTRLT